MSLYVFVRQTEMLALQNTDTTDIAVCRKLDRTLSKQKYAASDGKRSVKLYHICFRIIKLAGMYPVS